MSTKHRRERGRFDLQPPSPPLNGKASASPDAQSVREVRQPLLDADSGTSGGTGTSTSAGRIEVSPTAISTVASRAAQRSYGVVGLASRHARPGWAELLRRDEAHKGVSVSFSEGRVLIELFVVIEYGTRISEVARNIMSNVKFAVESALGMPVVQVNVNVQDIRVSEDSEPAP